MKRKITAFLITCMIMTAAAGCGNKAQNGESNTETPTETPTESGIEESSVASIDIAYHVSDYVTLGDYKNLEITLNEADYEVTEESVNSYVDQMISYTQPYVPDDSKTVVESGDIVDVDYVGKKDGVAFDGGSAENQYIDVDANANATSGTGYIEGFSNGLIGANVGDTIDSDVTFPEDYGNEDLNGQTVTFTFTVNAIARQVTREEIDDAFVQEYLQADSVEELYANTRATLEQDAESQKQSDIHSAVITKLVELCTVTEFPEGLVEARLDEYVNSFIEYYCSDGTALEDFLQTNYGMSEEDFLNESRTYLEDSLKQELILEAIVENENLEFDQEGYDTYVSGILANGGYAAEDDFYETLGSSRDSGENYVKKVYLANKAWDMLAEQANVTYTQAEEGTEAAEGTESVEKTEE